MGSGGGRGFLSGCRPLRIAIMRPNMLVGSPPRRSANALQMREHRDLCTQRWHRQ